MAKPLLTAAQMRLWEQDAFAEGRVTGADLMARAGRGAVAMILAEWPDLARGPGRAQVLCGPGNNGGDGYVVARLLRDRGWTVDVLALGDATRLPPDARANFERWGGPVRDAAVWTTADDAPFDLSVDALFGIGLARPIDHPILCQRLGHLDGARGSVRTVALDVPSGLDGDTGRMLGDAPGRGVRCARAMLTVGFGAMKLGHVLGDGPAYCGALRIVDLGIGAAPSDAVPLLGAPDWAELDKGAGHKFDHGHALVVSGGMGRSGAARLAARGALRVGAGLVTMGAPGSAMLECAAQLTAIMLRRCEGSDDLEALLADGRLSALCLGPGLGVDGRGADLAAAALSSGLPTVLDADALTLVGRESDLAGALHPGCVLTPHLGEFGRLAPDLAERVRAGGSKLDAVRVAAERLGCTVLLKGPDSVIADPLGRASVHGAVYERSAPWLATAGSGDVLAGLIAGLLARGQSPRRAAEIGAWLHGEAALRSGPGLIAEDLPERIPVVLQGLAQGEG